MIKKNKPDDTQDLENKDLQNDELELEGEQPEIDEAPLGVDEINELKNQLLRSLADNENTRRRHEKEKDDLSSYVMSNFAKEMLSVLDNLQRAMEVSSKIDQDNSNIDSNTKNFIEGVQLTEKQLNFIFEKFKISKIVSLDSKFDPNVHQAMFEIDNDEVDEGMILQVVQDGFKIEDRLLRPALVGVSKKSAK
ncbi:MAG: nucleotide exchange factor GrpE [Candidatus Pelagibacterales bacterium]|jgi:molecular chaperone GrpE|tara:strand:- start:1388 stop:1966 length:579 start_codon:yes stop_codon:yes gene_type:complete